MMRAIALGNDAAAMRPLPTPNPVCTRVLRHNMAVACDE